MLNTFFFLRKLHNTLECRWATGLWLPLQNLSTLNTMLGQNEWHISLHFGREGLDSKLKLDSWLPHSWQVRWILSALGFVLFLGILQQVTKVQKVTQDLWFASKDSTRWHFWKSAKTSTSSNKGVKIQLLFCRICAVLLKK